MYLVRVLSGMSGGSKQTGNVLKLKRSVHKTVLEAPQCPYSGNNGPRRAAELAWGGPWHCRALDTVAGPSHTTAPALPAQQLRLPAYPATAGYRHMTPGPVKEPQVIGQGAGIGWNPRKGFGVDVLRGVSVDNHYSDVSFSWGQRHHVSCSCLCPLPISCYMALRKGSISICWNELKLNFKFRSTLSKGWLPVTIMN